MGVKGATPAPHIFRLGSASARHSWRCQWRLHAQCSTAWQDDRAVAGLVGSVGNDPRGAGSEQSPDLFSGGSESIESACSIGTAEPDREQLALQLVAQGSDPLENPSGVIITFGYLNDTNKTRTEPDENTYLVFDHNPGGPTAGYDYGRHFLYQGHENAGNLAYISRINLDVLDPAHRITLLTPVDATTQLTGFNSVDGSAWNPFTRTLLFTMEAGTNGGVVEITPDWPPQIRKLNGIVGKAGYEGVVPDDKGNLLLIEDVGGTTVNVVQGDPGSSKTARQPNSFVYRFEPYDKNDLSLGGQLFALQVWIDGTPIVFNSADPVSDTFSDAQLKLHTLGASYPVTWVLVHDTNIDGFDDFDATASAKTKRRLHSSDRKSQVPSRFRLRHVLFLVRRATPTRTRVISPSWPRG